MQTSVARNRKIDAEARTRWLSHIAWVVPFGLVFAPTVHWLWQRWTMTVWHNSHGLFVPFIVGYLVRDALQRDPTNGEEASSAGFLFLIPGLALVLVDSAIKTQLLSALGLVLCLPGLSLLLLGARRTKLLIFPWLLAPFMLPIPAAFAEPILLLLRQISAVGATELVSLIGIPVFREYTTLYLANEGLAITDACSGFSTLYASITFALFLAYLADSPKRRTLVLALALPLGIICNIVRCTALALIVQAWGSGLLEPYLHSGSGLASFAVTIFILVMITNPLLFRRGAV